MNLEQMRALVAAQMNAVDQLIIEQARLTDVELIQDIGHHIVQNRGKRLRPFLVLMTARLFGNIQPHHITMAAVIEFIHTATLLHDDVVDESSMRRGNPTANQIWGNQASVLVGDFLYSRAFQLMVGVGNMDVMDIMSETTNVIASGEVLQLVANQNDIISEQDYFKIIERKTAKLFAAAAELGGLLAGANHAEQTALQTFGMELGLAFQIVDDLLDYIGEDDNIGKNIGDDLQSGKVTLPIIYLLQNANSDDAQAIKHCIQQADDAHLTQLLSFLKNSEALQKTALRAKQSVETAKVALNQLPDNETRSTLLSLCDFVVERTF